MQRKDSDDSFSDVEKEEEGKTRMIRSPMSRKSIDMSRSTRMFTCLEVEGSVFVRSHFFEGHGVLRVRCILVISNRHHNQRQHQYQHQHQHHIHKQSNISMSTCSDLHDIHSTHLAPHTALKVLLRKVGQRYNYILTPPTQKSTYIPPVLIIEHTKAEREHCPLATLDAPT